MSVSLAYSQDLLTLNGHILDAENGELLIGATIYVEELKKGTATNVYGFYSITMLPGKYHFKISYLGYKSHRIEIDVKKDIQKDIELVPSSKSLEEVVVLGDRGDANIRSTDMSLTRLSIKEIHAIPVLFGEQDVLKTIQLLPGVQAVGEGSSGYYVRGGDAGQNLILLDEAPVYNPSHLLGFFSVFNSDAIKDVKLYKGGIPAEYGGRISSVLDIHMKNGNNRYFNVSGGLGLISSRLMIEGPIKKETGSFLVSARRTYADIFLNFAKDTLIKDNSLYFYDFNMKANYTLGKKDRIYLSGYFGRDFFMFQNRFGIDWGNATATFRWNHLFNNRLFLNSTFIYSDYNYVFKVRDEEGNLDVKSAIRDFSLKEDFQYYINPDNTLKFGVHLIHHTYLPGEITTEGGFPVNEEKLDSKYALETAVYFSQEFKPFSWLNFEYGLRFSYYMMLGPGEIYDIDSNGDILDSTYYQAGEVIVRYPGLEPRASVNFRINHLQSLKLSYNRINQYTHLLSNTNAGSPTDVWVPSSNNIKPQVADQVAVGYYRNFRDNMWETSLELYYKNMANQIDYKNGANIMLNELVETQLEFGRGWSYGMELLVRKNTGKLHGWIAYTLSRSERLFENLNEGQIYPAKQDRIHDFSIVTIYDLNKRWSVSGTWVYYTGNAVTFPSGKYQIEGKTVNMYTERNGYRMPAYNRLDLGATRTNKVKGRFESSWNFSIYNVYARKNAYAINFEQDENDPTKTNAVRLSLFSIIPSVTFNFKF
ncbi:MAG: TonB-dependent receptor [Bacteroidales bacterium]|nr:TonB-dependent receptor [Bacteroidales bacterium]